MKAKLPKFSLYLVFVQTGLTLASSEKRIAEVGKKLSLSCEVSTIGNPKDMQWNKNGKMFVGFNSLGQIRSKLPGNDRYQMTSRTSNVLETSNVQLMDSGSYTCVKGSVEGKTWELIVIEITAKPSDTLLVSENLELSIESSPPMNLDVAWWKDGTKIGDGLKLSVKNTSVKQSGDYICRIKLGDGVEHSFPTTISVNGFSPTPAIVYMSGKQPVTLPFIFNFKVREFHPQDGIKVVEGNVTYLPSTKKLLHTLQVTSGVACWPSTCQLKTNPDDLSLNINSPKIGLYQMEIVLQVGNRSKRLKKDVCVANLTVSTSHNNIVEESNVTLLCSINCIEQDGKLCWRHTTVSHDICGPPGKNRLEREITILQQTIGNWTCSVHTGERRFASAKLTLKMSPGFLSSPLFWVTVVIGVIVFVIIVTILTVMIARHRRVRRARYRAWLIENLHQHRRCECDYKGFAPQRLRQNI